MIQMETLTGEWTARRRLNGLRRFAVAITVLNLLGHSGVLGFEQSWAHPVVAVLVAYGLEILLEWLDARARGQAPRYRGGPAVLIDFLLSAHISAMAVAMLLYSNDRLGPVVFATAVAVTSKHLLRVRVGAHSRHFLNPSNFGIAVTLLLFPWVGIAPPYMFTENLAGAADWVLPGVMVVLGSLLNTKFTRKLPLIGAWLTAFALQALVRGALTDVSVAAALVPMTGPAFLLFTFYMVTDPATTPVGVRGQLLFGGGVGAVYGLLVANHVVFGLFFSLGIVCVVRGVALALGGLLAQSPVRAARSVSLEAASVPVILRREDG